TAPGASPPCSGSSPASRPRRESARLLPAQWFLLRQDEALRGRLRAGDLADDDVQPLAQRASGWAAAPAIRPALPSRARRRPGDGARGRDPLRRRRDGAWPLAVLNAVRLPRATAATSASCEAPKRGQAA